MRGLSASQIVHVWERGEGQSDVERALTLLAVASPECSREQLLSLSVGERDALLLELREATFGSAFNIYAKCPHCAESLECEIEGAEIRSATKDTGRSIGATESREHLTAGFVLRFRLPDSTDLAAAANCEDAPTARRLIFHRCVLEARRGEVPVTTEQLPEKVIADFSKHVAECDPQAEIFIHVRCPRCHYEWQAVFDIASFLWQEINALAKHLLREVAVLARAYGWREADILTMSAARRQFYLELAS